LSKLRDRLIAIASLAINLAIAAACVAHDRQMAGYTGDRLMAACANRSEYVSGDNQPRVPNDPHPPSSEVAPGGGYGLRKRKPLT
jgi:hypothetical protein